MTINVVNLLKNKKSIAEIVKRALMAEGYKIVSTKGTNKKYVIIDGEGK